jgi:hypothetical protein
MAMIFLGLGMQMSFDGIMYRFKSFSFFHGTLFLSKGGERFLMGP